jgi:hypothetical protein
MSSRFEHWKGRATRFALVLFVHALAVILGYFLSPPIKLRKPEPELQVTMLPSLDEKKEKARAKPRTARRSEATPRDAAIKAPEPIVELPMMLVSSEVFRASDISKIRSAPPADPGTDFAAGDSDPSVGEGPGGAKVYQAEWYREPTDAEINGYLPKNLRQSGWALIICRTIPDYRVEDCRELEEWPMGSGLARSMRQAAWQFRVRPTRINGKPQIGTWVRIRFDMTLGFKK